MVPCPARLGVKKRGRFNKIKKEKRGRKKKKRKKGRRKEKKNRGKKRKKKRKKERGGKEKREEEKRRREGEGRENIERETREQRDRKEILLLYSPPLFFELSQLSGQSSSISNSTPAKCAQSHPESEEKKKDARTQKNPSLGIKTLTQRKLLGFDSR